MAIVKKNLSWISYQKMEDGNEYKKYNGGHFFGFFGSKCKRCGTQR